MCFEMPISGAKSPAGRPQRRQASRMSSRCSGVMAGSGVAGAFNARRDRDGEPGRGPRPDSGGMKGRSISGVESNASGAPEETLDSAGCASPRLRFTRRIVGIGPSCWWRRRCGRDEMRGARNLSIVGHNNLPCGLRRRWEEGIAPPLSAEIMDRLSARETRRTEPRGANDAVGWGWPTR